MKLSKLFEGLLQARKSITDRLQELQSEIEATQRDRNALTMAPTARSDVDNMLRKWVADSADEFRREFASRMEIFARDSRSLADKARIASFVTLAGNDPELKARALDCLLCATYGEKLLAPMGAALDRLDWAAIGVTAADKAERIQRLDARMQELQQEQADLIAQAEEAGISLR